MARRAGGPRAGHDAFDREGHRAEAHLEGHPVGARPKLLCRSIPVRS